LVQANKQALVGGNCVVTHRFFATRHGKPLVNLPRRDTPRGADAARREAAQRPPATLSAAQAMMKAKVSR
jgi:hypothetical protein